MKKCSICKQNKTLDRFNNDKSRKGGKVSRCKDCLKIITTAYRQTDRYKKWKIRNYAQYKKIDPEKKKARDKVLYALKTGRLVRASCLKCPRVDTQAHHDEGYEGGNALRVVWYCPPHHSGRHSELRK